MKRIGLVLALLLGFAGSAHAQIQKDGPQVWPGKIMIGARPLGVAVNFSGSAWGGLNGNALAVGDLVMYKFGIDVAGIVANFDKVTLWLGGEFNLGGRAYIAAIEPGVFVQITLEKLLKIPLVPMVRAGISGPIYVPYGFGGATTFGAFELKVGAGVYYFLTKNVGLGMDTNFAFGPGFASNGFGGTAVGFGGYWDFMFGGRFTF